MFFSFDLGLDESLFSLFFVFDSLKFSSLSLSLLEKGLFMNFFLDSSFEFLLDLRLLGVLDSLTLLSEILFGLLYSFLLLFELLVRFLLGEIFLFLKLFSFLLCFEFQSFLLLNFCLCFFLSNLKFLSLLRGLHLSQLKGCNSLYIQFFGLLFGEFFLFFLSFLLFLGIFFHLRLVLSLNLVSNLLLHRFLVLFRLNLGHSFLLGFLLSFKMLFLNECYSLLLFLFSLFLFLFSLLLFFENLLSLKSFLLLLVGLLFSLQFLFVLNLNLLLLLIEGALGRVGVRKLLKFEVDLLLKSIGDLHLRLFLNSKLFMELFLGLLLDLDERIMVLL